MRAFGFLLVLAALTWGAVQLADNPGQVAIIWQGYRINFSVGVLLLLVAAIAVLWATLSRLWRWRLCSPGRPRPLLPQTPTHESVFRIRCSRLFSSP